MFSNSAKKFEFASLKQEISVSFYKGNRQADLNPGVKVDVHPGNIIIIVPCNNFKKEIQTDDPFYKNIYSKQAGEINKLIELIENINANCKSTEFKTLESMQSYMREVCEQSVAWAPTDELKKACNAYQFIVPGKRLNHDFELIDNPKKALQPS